jgi:hypothetical protein
LAGSSRAQIQDIVSPGRGNEVYSFLNKSSFYPPAR